MREERESPQVNIDPSRSMDLVMLASRTQTEKLRMVLERIDQIAKLDPTAVRNLAEILDNSTANGGCGIGCW
jgi:hypothetical protein